MKPVISTIVLLASTTALSACGGAGGSSGCKGVTLKVEPYAMPTNVWWYVTNSSNDPKTVTVATIKADGTQEQARTVAIGAKQAHADEDGTYLAPGSHMEIVKCE